MKMLFHRYCHYIYTIQYVQVLVDALLNGTCKHHNGSSGRIGNFTAIKDNGEVLESFVVEQRSCEAASAGLILQHCYQSRLLLKRIHLGVFSPLDNQALSVFSTTNGEALTVFSPRDNQALSVFSPCDGEAVTAFPPLESQALSVFSPPSLI